MAKPLAGKTNQASQPKQPSHASQLSKAGSRGRIDLPARFRLFSLMLAATSSSAFYQCA
jgi:hypothetical protein